MLLTFSCSSVVLEVRSLFSVKVEALDNRLEEPCNGTVSPYPNPLPSPPPNGSSTMPALVRPPAGMPELSNPCIMPFRECFTDYEKLIKMALICGQEDRKSGIPKNKRCIKQLKTNRVSYVEEFSRYKTTKWAANTQVTISPYFANFSSCRHNAQLPPSLVLR